MPSAKDQRVTNMKVKKTWLFTYLKEKYSHRLSTKMSALFDWGNTNLRFVEFHTQLSTNLTKHVADYSE